jgi:outer membrane protein TolC
MIHKKLKLKFHLFLVFCAGISFGSTAQRVLTIDLALDIAEEFNPNMRTTKLTLEGTQYELQAQLIGLKPNFSMTVNPFGYSQRRGFEERTSQWYTNTKTTSDTRLTASVPFLPTDAQIRLVNEFGWTDSRSIVDGAKNSNTAFSNNISIRIDQPLFTYNRLQTRLKTLTLNYENAGISYALQRLTLESNITGQFYSVILAENQLEISRDALKNEVNNYEIIQYKVAADMSPKEELYQAEVNLASAQSTVEQNTVRLNNLYDQLKQTLGMPLKDEINVTANIDDIPLIVIDLDQAVNYAMAARMEIRQREIAMERAEMEMLAVKATNEFSGNVSLSLGVMGDNNRFANIYETPTNSPSVLVSFSIPIFDWGQRKARIRSQQTAQTIAQLRYDEEIVGIELAIRQTLRQLENSLTQINILQKNVDNSQRQYELQQVRYREGDLTGLQMSQYQDQLSNSRISLARQKVDYKNTLLSLKIATLYDFEKDEPVLPVRELSTLTTK